VSELARLLEIAAEAATSAGALLQDHAGRQAGVSSKSTPTDLVSEADLAAERTIRELLLQLRPDDGFLGEEGGAHAGSSGLRWVVDPLDGTVNYLFSIPQWSVSVAVVDELGPLAGVIYDPNRGELFAATRDGPAFLRGADGDRRELVAADAAAPRSTPGTLAHAMVATGFAYSAEVRAAQAEVLARLLPHVRDVRRLGSAALDLAWTAAGRYDAYYERSVKPWDIAAGTLICTRAGLAVVELGAHGVLPEGILAAPAGLVDELLAIVA
jgi:myo-inositol-1(or 4)-monophosphatase